MLSDSRGSVIISSLGRIDHGSLWIMSVGLGRIENVFLSDAKYLSLHPGTHDFFSVNHHFDSNCAGRFKAKDISRKWASDSAQGLISVSEPLRRH
jgi:hypothetical protein